MIYVKIGILIAVIFAMETVGMAYIQRGNLKSDCLLWEKIKYLFPQTRNRTIFYIITLAIGIALSYVLVVVYADSDIFIQKIRMAVIYGILCPIAMVDYRTQRIPNKLLLVASGVWVLSTLVELIKNPDMVFDDVKYSIIAAVVIFLVCFVCKLVIKNGIGMGDIKLFMVMGLLQGPTGMSGAIFMSMIVAFFGAIGMLVLKKKTRKDNISFGPFILIGTTISMFLTGV